MGQRVNFNKTGKKFGFSKNIIIAAVAIIILIFLIYGFTVAYKNVTTEKPKIDTETKFYVDDYNTLADLLYQYDCTYLSEETIDGITKIYVSFDRNLYTSTTSNEARFLKIITAVADYRNLVSFDLIDSNRKITIEVVCNGEYITSIIINGDENYYENHDSKINANMEKGDDVTFEVQSDVLQGLVNNNWKDTINFGSRESTCNGYNIYFDEGIYYKKVAGEVYNLIFTTNYTGSVVNGVRPGATEQEIKDALGSPTFERAKQSIGYRGSEFYVFFDLENEQISIYPVKNLENEEEFKELIDELNETNDFKTFVNDLTDLYLDYDIYQYDSEYVDLQYTLLGIHIDVASDSLKNGIYVYQNYKGNFDISNKENVYIEATDLVLEEELTRAMEENLKRCQTGDTSELEPGDISQKFAIASKGKLTENETGFKGVTFFSKDKDFPDSELDRTLVISSFKWYDDYNFVYSVDYDGIYVYNCATRVNVKIHEVKDDEIMINSIEGTKITYNDSGILHVDIK